MQKHKSPVEVSQHYAALYTESMSCTKACNNNYTPHVILIWLVQSDYMTDRKFGIVLFYLQNILRN